MRFEGDLQKKNIETNCNERETAYPTDTSW